MSMVCDKGKGRPLGELKATFSSALKVLHCSKTIMSYDQSQCVLLAFLCLRAWIGRDGKGAGFGSTKGGGAPPPLGGGWGPPPPYSPPNCRTPLGVTHWLAAAPVSLLNKLICNLLIRNVLHLMITQQEQTTTSNTRNGIPNSP